MSEQKPKFTPLPIGTYVSFNQSVQSTFKRLNTKGLSYTPHNCPPLEGIIVGGSYICLGEVVEDKKNSHNTGFRDRLIIKEKVFVYLVRIGYMNKPFKVLPEAIAKRHISDYILYSDCSKNLYNDCVATRQPKIPFVHKRKREEIVFGL